MNASATWMRAGPTGSCCCCLFYAKSRCEAWLAVGAGALDCTGTWIAGRFDPRPTGRGEW